MYFADLEALLHLESGQSEAEPHILSLLLLLLLSLLLSLHDWSMMFLSNDIHSVCFYCWNEYNSIWPPHY